MRLVPLPPPSCSFEITLIASQTRILFSFFFYGFVVNWNELNLGLGEETVEPNEGDQGAEACSQHLRR